MNNNLQNTIGLPSTDSRTWEAEYKVGDIVKVRVDFKDLSNEQPLEIVSFYEDNTPYKEDSRGNNVGGFKRGENPSGKLYQLMNGENWEGKDLEPIVSQNIPITSNNATTGVRLYESALLTALNVSPKIQAVLSKDILDSAYVIYEIQKIYAQTQEGNNKNQLALAIAEGSRILLFEINKISISKPTQSTPPTLLVPHQTAKTYNFSTPPTPPKPTTPPTPPTPPKPTTPPTPPTPPKPQKPKTQKPKTPPTPPTPPQGPQLSCKEIKEAIKGLTLLAKLGDDESIETIKTLKNTLKTQNCN